MTYLSVCILVGFTASWLGIPAGWLLGSIVTGILWGVLIGGIQFDRKLFKIALAFVAASIGLRLDPNILIHMKSLLLPLFFTISLTLMAGYFLSVLLYKKSNLDPMTAFFCCIPGGASEIIGISRDFGADDRIVAAFHTVRMTFFVLVIPLIVVTLNAGSTAGAVLETKQLALSHLLFFPIVAVLTLFLDKKLRIPGGTLLFSIIIGFILSSFVLEIPDPPAYLSGIGQAFIGGLVGIRFDRLVLYQLLKVGKITVGIMSIFFGVSLLTSVLFHYMTKLSFSTSLIGIVPAGAAEMSATAIALDLSPSVVASLHIVRVILLFLALPLFIKIFKTIHKEPVKT
ncbi:AbrB family transcriptional regulator [Sporosarcina pasteurii]|uniref:AbrB family transcriptional regulator n=1 Tax=Sporosarcina pasteurii TaxID=1474 RepID=UPI002115CC38|nr:AbrB family transcriptional regulator [Sporosarcina pasteurii]